MNCRWFFAQLVPMLLSWREAAYTFRVLCKQPLVSALAILSVGFGISVNSVFFGLIDLLILRPVPVSHPEELVRVSTISPTGRVGDDRLLLSTFQALHDRSNVFAGLFAWNDDALRNVQAENGRYLGEVDEVSGDFFRTLGEQPLLGRWIDNADVELGSGRSAQVAVLSFRCWREHYHADPHIIGKAIIADDVPLIIIGVTKRDFSEIDMDVTSDAIVPIGFSQNGSKRGWYNVTARLKPGVSVTQARAQLATLWAGILDSTAQPTMKPEERTRYLARKIELTSESRGDSSLREKYSQPVIMLMSLAGMILLITCVNLASIMLARAMSRRTEFQVRLALGASRWGILRLVLLEAVFISFAGSVIGIAVAFWSMRLLIDLFWTGYVSPGLHLTIDTRVLIFMVGAAFLTAILFGLAPAIRATHVSPSPAPQYNRGAAIGRFRIGKSLITTQVILAFVLVTTALLLATTLHRLNSVDLGYDRSNVLVMTLFKQSQHGRIPNAASYYRKLASEFLKIPGTDSVSFSQSAPAFNFEIAESASTSGVTARTLYDSVAPEFFHLLRVPVLEGREFGWQNDETTTRVAILSESLASRLYPHENPIGKKVDFGESVSGKGLTIVGVVRDAGLWRPQTQHPMAIYVPLMQVCSGCSPLALIRTTTSPMAIAHVSEHTVQSMGYQYSVRTQSLEERFDKMLVVERVSSWLSVAFGGAALLLTSLGLYGLISYIVHMRYTEIGIRIALGATRGGVLFLVLYDALFIVVTGVLIGVPTGWATSRALASKYANISHDIFSGMSCASLIVLLTAFLAAYLPALRASRIDPASALRGE
jgi:predicted permease